MKNQDIRTLASEKGIHLWEVADKYGVTDSTFSRKLRKELPTEEKNRIVAIIESLAEQKGDDE